MSTPIRSEKELRIEILEQSLRLKPGETANYFHEPESSVARELIEGGFVTGSAGRTGGAGVTGIRDSGRDYLKAQRPLQRIKRFGIRAFVLICSGIVVIATYIFALDSVKKVISDFLSHFLK
jgi:hypothetical protein